MKLRSGGRTKRLYHLGSDEREYHRKRYSENRRTRALHLFHNAKQRARKSEVPFTITLDHVLEKITAGHCEITGVPFSFEPGSPLVPSLDRKESSEGYTPENIRMTTWFYNRAKNSSTDAETTSLILQAAAGLNRVA